MIDRGKEAHFGRRHGIVVWKEEFELEAATYMSHQTCISRSVDFSLPSYGDWLGPYVLAVSLLLHPEDTSRNVFHTYIYSYVEVAEVVLMWDCGDAWDSYAR